MAENKYSTIGIHLPVDKELIQFLKKLSDFVNLITMIMTGITLFGFWAIDLKYFMMFIIATATLWLHATESSSNRIKSIFTFLLIWDGGMLVLWSIYNIWQVQGKINVLTNLSFLFTGLAIAIPYIKTLLHRFHPAQLLAFITLIINLATMIGYFYQLLVPTRLSSISIPTFYTALLFSSLSLTIILRWPGRGFLGNFTTQSEGSVAILKQFLYTTIFIPVLGFGGLIVTRTGYEIAAILTVLFIALTAMISWLHVRLLYKTELELFVMEEELRVHNISLKLTTENLEIKMQELEKIKRDYRAGISYQDRFRDMAESLG